ncbi:MAG: GerMN domain-containing protein [Syntrophomonadaceae bacterium]|jgi:germination protein M|nr:GerMN domain-containing protein [Syntrophomonadaceae bacterium]
MDKRIVVILALILVAICLIAGGCSTFTGDSSLKAWKELLSLTPESETANSQQQGTSLEDLLLDKQAEGQDTMEEYIVVFLYFADETGSSLVSESRRIVKKEGIARQTLQELIKGPDNNQYKNIFPTGSQLLDINITEDGSCIVDLNSEVRKVKNAQEEKLLVNAIVKTLGQFPTIKRVSFLIDGQVADHIAGSLDLSEPIEIVHEQ